MKQKERKPSGRKLAGRPVLESGKRTRKIDVRFTEEEYQLIQDMEKTLDIKKTDIVRMRVLGSASSQLLNAKELIAALDSVGGELGKSGSNINQLARYANVLQNRGMLSVQVLEQFNLLFEKYLSNQQLLELTLRKIMRALIR
ncbi:plasmid mobilization protein [Pedobacter sp. GR22-6]|uniref:plasmid mobilization protein n=1 Tax=Pedobacter sp. GR22-6 TaxID=3127957 RepID=UPI00307E5FA7